MNEVDDGCDEAQRDVPAHQVQGEEICLQKIQALLVNYNLKSDERSLVVLLLLTRVKCAEQLVIDNIIGSRGILCFIIRLLRSNHPTFARLACRCITRLQRCQCDWIIIARTLLNVIHDRTNLPMGTADEDLLHALVSCVQMDESIKISAHDFDSIWQRFTTGTRIPDSAKEYEAYSAATVGHWRFIDQSLEQVLQHEDVNTWMVSFLRLWELSAPEICRTLTSVPQWFQSLLLSIVSIDSNLTPKNQWHAMMFQSTISMAVYTPALNFFCPQVANALADIIMVHLGSPQSDLRSHAWDACSILVSQHGWSWIPQPCGSRRLTKSSHLCTWTRLAAGEYRIQLGLISAEFGTSFQHDTLNACGLVVASALRRVIEEATTVDSGKHLTLDADAILHLRRSFSDTLQSSIIYVAGEAIPITTPCKVLGSLLGEFSIWDELPEGTTVEQALLAVKNCISNDVVEIIPWLVKVLDSEELQGKRVQSLASVGILGDRLPAYFADYWRENAFRDVEFIPWACAAIENWLCITNPKMAQRKNVAKEILRWMDKILGNGVPDAVDTDAVSSAVGCYVVLVGGHRPSPQDAALIRTALSISRTMEECS